MKGSKKILRYAGYASTVLILAVLIFSAINIVQGVQPFYAVSDNPSSMSPAMNYGDVALAYKVPFNDLHVGDIIIFKDPRGGPQTIVHRVVAIEMDASNSTYLVTKGDNGVTNPTNDPWKVTQKDYLSKAIVVVPLVGYLSPALWGSSAPVIFAIIIAIILIAYFFYPKKKKEGSEKSEESGNGGA